jgi:outer membrane immunogenic protein
MRWKPLLLASASSLAISIAPMVSAGAADLPVKAPPKVVADHFDWRGVYAGLHGGGAWLDHRNVTIGNIESNRGCVPSGLNQTTCDFRPASALIGGHIGWNGQSGNFIYGVELDASWTSLRTTRFDVNNLVPGGVTESFTKVDWLGSARGRIGMAFSPTMIYLTGGLAVGHFHSGFTFPLGNCGAGSVCDYSVNKTKVGWVAGGGIEHYFTRAWSARAEVLYYDLGSDAVTGNLGTSIAYTSQLRHRVTAARGGFSYRW